MKEDKINVSDDTDAGEMPIVSVGQTLLGLIDGVDNDTAASVLFAWDVLPDEVKASLEDLYDALGRVGRDVKVEELTKKLVHLKKICGKDKLLKSFYDAAEKDVKTYSPIIIGKVNRAEIERMIKEKIPVEPK